MVIYCVVYSRFLWNMFDFHLVLMNWCSQQWTSCNQHQLLSFVSYGRWCPDLFDHTAVGLAVVVLLWVFGFRTDTAIFLDQKKYPQPTVQNTEWLWNLASVADLMMFCNKFPPKLKQCKTMGTVTPTVCKHSGDGFSRLKEHLRVVLFKGCPQISSLSIYWLLIKMQILLNQKFWRWRQQNSSGHTGNIP